jgi:transcriptional regulator of acetoin/glycerol metabolism
MTEGAILVQIGERDAGPAPRLAPAPGVPTGLAHARENFLNRGLIARDVRTTVADSWRRSWSRGFRPGGWPPPTAVSEHAESILLAAIDVAVRPHEALLRECRTTLTLVDRDASVLATWFDDDLTARRGHVVAGSSLGEGQVGTHAANVALHGLLPVAITGDEHLSDRFTASTTVALPIFHPVTKRLLGALAATCPLQEFSPMLTAWLAVVGQAVTSRLLEARHDIEFTLLQAFLGARKDARHPVICLTDSTVLCNAAASRLLSGADQSLLWEKASLAVQHDQQLDLDLCLSSGLQVRVRVDAIHGELGPIGAKIELREVSRAGDVNVPPSGTPTHHKMSAAGVVGHGVAWRRLCTDIAAANGANSDRLVLVGEAGTGKTAVARALLPPHAHFIDARTEPDVAEAIESALHRGAPGILIQHLESAGDGILQQLPALVKAAGAGTPVYSTFTAGHDPTRTSEHLDEALGPLICVPPLRDRMDDLDVLIRVLTRRNTADGVDAVRWMPDSIQVLCRVEWPQNVDSLESLIRRMTSECRRGYVDARSLPDSIRSRATRRVLSRLEQLEATEITECLRRTHGNKVEAAQLLGIARSTLYRRLRALGIDLSGFNY